MTKEREGHVVGNLSNFPEGSHRVVRVGRREIGVFNIGGELYGLPNVCPHRRWQSFTSGGWIRRRRGSTPTAGP